MRVGANGDAPMKFAERKMLHGWKVIADSSVRETGWMDFLRTLGIVGIVIHHWLLFIPFDRNPVAVSAVDEFVKEVGGTGVQLFFILSGCGLAVSYLASKERFLLGEWVQRRFRKIVLPYWITVAGTFALANVAALSAGNHSGAYSWPSLLAYLSFTRNHHEPSQGMNPSLWFMPVMIGLYALFPILMKFLKKYGISPLLILSGFITYGSISLFEFSGYAITHQNTLFLFFVLEFAIGMVIGYIWSTSPDRFGCLLGTKSFILGLGFYGLSYALTELWKYGDLYNDALTGAGLFLMTISLWGFVWRKTGDKVDSIVREVSRVSYMMYLIHVPLILYIVKPILSRTIGSPLNPLLSLVLSGCFTFVVFLLARVLYRPVMSISFGQTWFSEKLKAES